MKQAIISILIISVLLASGCAEPEYIKKCVVTEPYSFWSGLWHGMIAPISFIFSLLSDNISMYGVNNNGGWYDFGFVLGAGILTIGSSSASK